MMNSSDRKIKVISFKRIDKKDFRFGFFFLDFTRAFDVSYVIRNFNFSCNCNLFSVQNMKQKQIKKAEKNMNSILSVHL